LPEGNQRKKKKILAPIHYNGFVFPDTTSLTVEAMHPFNPLYRSLGDRTYERGDNLWINVGRFTLISPPCGKIYDVSREE